MRPKVLSETVKLSSKLTGKFVKSVHNLLEVAAFCCAAYFVLFLFLQAKNTIINVGSNFPCAQSNILKKFPNL